MSMDTHHMTGILNKKVNEHNNDDTSHDFVTERTLATRIIVTSVLAILLILVWIPFDYLLDPLNFRTFLILRIICSIANLIVLIVFIKTGKPARHFRKYGLFIYISLIMTILPMVIITDAKYPFYLGFSTVFFSISILLIWPLHYFLIPLFMTGFILAVFDWQSTTSHANAVTGIFMTLNVSLLAGLASWLTYRNFLTNEKLVTKLNHLSLTDRLTGLNNRRYFDLYLSRELVRITREGGDIAILMLDVDYFKKYNDNYGHLQGDECLRQVADCLRRTITRESDFVARYGGEEFTAVLSNSNASTAAIIATRIIDKLSDLRIPHAHSSVAPFVTISIGIACWEAKQKTTSAGTLLELADSALYKAKENGRNQFVLA